MPRENSAVEMRVAAEHAGQDDLAACVQPFGLRVLGGERGGLAHLNDRVAFAVDRAVRNLRIRLAEREDLTVRNQQIRCHVATPFVSATAEAKAQRRVRDVLLPISGCLRVRKRYAIGVLRQRLGDALEKHGHLGRIPQRQGAGERRFSTPFP